MYKDELIKSQMNATVQFTRYLYIKDEVKYSILISILKKNDEALFWAYEFYYSGFKEETWNLLWKMYYDFYATLNPKFKKYIKEKYEAFKNSEKDGEKYIAQVISNFKIRKWNMDMFLLKLCSRKTQKSLIQLLNEKNYEGLAYYVLNSPVNEEDCKSCSSYFCGLSADYKKISKTWSEKTTKDEFLADIIHLYSLESCVKIGKNLHILGEEDLSPYKTIFAHYDSSFYPYKILPLATKCAIDSESMLSLFELSRDSIPHLRDLYHDNWLYCTLNTPIWSNRIEEFEGIVNHETKKINFEDDDDEDEFYDYFGYEPDEQKMEIQNRNIGPIKTSTTWKSVFEQSKKGIYIPQEDFWLTISKISY